MSWWAKLATAVLVVACLVLVGTAPLQNRPEGVIGNWNVGAERYAVTGVFAGSAK